MITQRQRLLDAFQKKTDLMVYEIMAPRPMGLGIAQYNARIKELRETGHPIINVMPGHFRYVPNKEESMTTGYQKFQAAGMKLKAAHKPFYTEADDPATKLEKAKAWYKEHEDKMTDEVREEAIKRIEKLEDEAYETALS